MAYLIFTKNSADQEGALHKIASDENSLNNLNINQSNYNIIEIDQDTFNLIKFERKDVVSYNSNNIVTYKDVTIEPTSNVEPIKEYIEHTKNYIKLFLDSNREHPEYSLWNDFYNQLNSFNVDSIPLPLTTSLTEYFNNNNLISLNPLQLP